MDDSDRKSAPPAGRRFKRWLLIGALVVMVLVAVVGLIVAEACRPASETVRDNGGVRGFPTPGGGVEGPRRVTIGRNAFNVDLALNNATRNPGLGKRASLPADYGMLFVYPWPHGGRGQADEICFWMKDCLIDLDIAFISADRRIVTIYTMKAEPLDRPDDDLQRYWAKDGMQFALEVAGGEFARRSIKVGDRVDFSGAVEAGIRRAEP